MIPLGILFGLLSAISFGILDSLISLATRVMNALHSIVLTQSISVLLLLAELVLTEKQSFPVLTRNFPFLFLVGMGLGLVNVGSNLSLYKGLERGPVALISPIIASYGFMTTILSVSFLHDALTKEQGIAVALVLGGVLCCSLDGQSVVFVLTPWRSFSLSWSRGRGEWRKNLLQKHLGILCGLGAMAGIGVEFFSLSLATRIMGPVQPLLLSRFFSVLLLCIYASRQRASDWKRTLKGEYLVLSASLAVLDCAGMWCYDMGTQHAATSIVATLSSTYTLLPIFTGLVIYRERLAFFQWIGLVALVGGIALLGWAGK